MTGSNGETKSVTDSLGEMSLNSISSVLLLRSPYENCRLPQLPNLGGNGMKTFVVVSIVDEPESGIELLKEAFGKPSRTNVVAVRGVNDEVEGKPARIRSLRPSRLTNTDVIEKEVIGILREARPDSDEILLYFDSLTALIQYAGVDEVHELLEVLTSRFRSMEDTVGYFGMDPEAHYPTTLEKIGGIFDLYY